MIKKYIIQIFLILIICDCFLLSSSTTKETRDTMYHRIYKKLESRLKELKKRELFDSAAREEIKIIEQDMLFYEKVIHPLNK